MLILHLSGIHLLMPPGKDRWRNATPMGVGLSWPLIKPSTLITSCTPPKTNMDTQNYGLEKVIPFK